MSALTNIASDVVEIILRLFRGNKDERAFIEGEEILTEEEALAFTDDPAETIQSREKPDANANRELLELDSDEPSASEKPKNETEPDAELIELAPNTPPQETPINLELAANEPVNPEPRNRDQQREPEEPVNRDQKRPEQAQRQERPRSNSEDGLDDLAEQAIVQPEAGRLERRETPEIERPDLETADVVDISSREIITPDSFVTSDELIEVNTVETSNNPSMPDKLMDTPLESTLEGPERFEFSEANELSIGAISMDEPVTTGTLSDTFQGTGANDPTMEIEGQQVTLKMAEGQDFTQETPAIEPVAVAPAASLPTLGG